MDRDIRGSVIVFFIIVFLSFLIGYGLGLSKKEPQSAYSDAYFRCIDAAKNERLSIGECNQMIDPSKEYQSSLSREEIRDVIFDEIEDILSTKAALDGAIGEPTFIPLMQRICR